MPGCLFWRGLHFVWLAGKIGKYCFRLFYKRKEYPMDIYIKQITKMFESLADPNLADSQKKYLREMFEHYGIKSPDRRKAQKAFLDRANLPPYEELEGTVKKLWALPHRECQYFAQELAQRYVKQVQKSDIELYEYMAVTKPWWDTLDFIAVNLMGPYFQRFPEIRDERTTRWIDSNNVWLQRAAILFQLKYKNATDTHLLTQVIHALLGSKEFFINKAIGWVLREYGKTDPIWVKRFVADTELAPLSRREALKRIK